MIRLFLIFSYENREENQEPEILKVPCAYCGALQWLNLRTCREIISHGRLHLHLFQIQKSQTYDKNTNWMPPM